MNRRAFITTSGAGAAAAAATAQNDYDGHITPDHNVAAAGDNTGGQAYTSFVYGYIAASIKAAERQLNS